MLRMIVEIIVIVVIVVNVETVVNVVIGIMVVIIPATRVSMTQIGDDQINKRGDHQVYFFFIYKPKYASIAMR